MLRDPLKELEQVFAHSHNGKEIRINVTQLRKQLDSNADSGKAIVDLSEELVQRLLVNNGVEQHRLTRLLKLKDEEFAKLPIPIIILFRDHTWVLADGNHTLCAAFYRKMTQVEVYRVKQKKWEKFLVPNVGVIPYFGFSGIL